MLAICKSCFLKTFNESSKFVSNVLRNKGSSLSGITYDDKRGSHEPWHKIPEGLIPTVKECILSLSAYESHYCRKETTNKYLQPH